MGLFSLIKHNAYSINAHLTLQKTNLKTVLVILFVVIYICPILLYLSIHLTIYIPPSYSFLYEEKLHDIERETKWEKEIRIKKTVEGDRESEEVCVCVCLCVCVCEWVPVRERERVKTHFLLLFRSFHREQSLEYYWFRASSKYLDKKI